MARQVMGDALNFSGGWDVLLGLDPRHPADFPTSEGALTGIQPAYERQVAVEESDWIVESAVEGMVFGPWIGALARHAPRLSLLRGMAMDSVAHTAAPCSARARATQLHTDCAVQSMATPEARAT